MKFHRLFLPLGLACGLLSSCLYPYPPNPHNPVPGESPDPAQTENTIDSQAQQEIREARDQARRDAQDQLDSVGPSNDSGDSNPPEPPKKKDYRVAVPIPGKEGFVFNPFTNDPVDVRAIPPGTLVRDPNDPNPAHMFRVP